MHHKNRVFIFLLFLLGLAACQSASPIDRTEPTLEVISLSITPELTHWLPEVARCAGDLPNFAIITEVTPQTTELTSDPDLILRLGERRDGDAFVTLLGYEELVVIAGNDVPVTTLSLDNLQAIFTGTVTHWSQIAGEGVAQIDLNQPVQVLSYPDGNILRALFSDTYLESQTIAGDVIIFSTLDYLKTLLEKHPYAVGYLLKSQVYDNLETIDIEDLQSPEIQHYILAISSQEPQGKLRQLLLCLQSSR